jgi:photosystem II stability/assembly factor-like uncharacterized protein
MQPIPRSAETTQSSQVAAYSDRVTFHSVLVRLAMLSAVAASTLVATPEGLATGRHASPPSTEYDALLVSRADSSTLLLGTQHGLFRTTNGGQTWRPSGFGRVAVTSLAQTGRAILAGGRGLLAISRDGGRTWRRLHPQGLPDEEIEALTVDAARPSSVYVVLGIGGLYRSTDRATSFTLVSEQVGPAIRALAVGSDGVLAGDVTSGIYLSKNGRAWRHTAGGMVMGLAVNPRDSAQILAATFGVSRSSDGGARWKAVLRWRPMFGAVAWDPSHPSLAYAIGDNGTLWQSTNAGLRWIKLTGD